MNPLLAWLATYAVHSTVLLAAVALLTTFIVRRDAWRDALWKAALVGGVVTATVQTAIDIRPLVGRWDLTSGLAPELAPGGVVGATDAGARGRATLEASAPAPDSLGGRATPASHAPVDAPGRQAGARPIPWPLVVSVAWATIALALLLRLAALYFRVRRVLYDRRPVDDARALALLTELRRNAGWWGTVRLSMTTRCATPLALGRSEICVPEALLALPTDQLRSALAHELAHLARRDPLWQLGTGVLEAVFFFQPLNRLARRRLRDAAEHLSDDWAVRQTGSAVSLARCLASVASWVSPSDPLPNATIAMAEGGSPLLRRVERLLDGRALAGAPGRWMRLTAAVVLIAAVLGAAPVITARTQALQQARVEVIEIPNERGTLRQRFRLAVDRARERGLRDYWIAYAFEGTVGPFRTDSDPVPDRTGGPTLGDVMYQGKWDPRRTRGDIVPLFRMHVNDRGTVEITRVAGRSYEQPAMADVLPVYCLDDVTDDESLSLLDSLTAAQPLGPKRSALLAIVATHGSRRRGGLGAMNQRERDAVDAVFDVAMHDRDPDVQQNATEALPQFSPDRVAPLLARIAWEHPRSEVRQEAAETLGDLPTAFALPLLDSIALHHPDVDVARQAVEAMGQLETRGRYTDSDPDPNYNSNSNSNSNYNSDSDADDGRSELIPLGAGDFATARANARRYAAGKDSVAVRRLAQLLDHEPLHDADLIRDRGTWALARMKNDALVDPLIAALRDDDWRIRSYAVWSLGIAGDESARAAVREALTDPHWRVRSHAASAAGTLHDLDAVGKLIDLLAHSRWQVRAAAAENLGVIGDNQALASLKRAASDSHTAVRDAAETALARLR